jgi:hypothetical protein
MLSISLEPPFSAGCWKRLLRTPFSKRESRRACRGLAERGRLKTEDGDEGGIRTLLLMGRSQSVSWKIARLTSGQNSFAAKVPKSSRTFVSQRWPTFVQVRYWVG